MWKKSEHFPALRGDHAIRLAEVLQVSADDLPYMHLIHAGLLDRRTPTSSHGAIRALA